MDPWRAIARPWRAFRRADDGAAVVELAICVPLLLVLVAAAVDVARVVVTGIAVSSAVRAGAQYGAQSTATANDTVRIDSAVRADFNEPRYGPLTIIKQRQCRCPGVGAAWSCTSLCVTPPSYPPQVFITVTASRAVPLLIPYPGLGATLTTSRTARLRAQ